VLLIASQEPVTDEVDQMLGAALAQAIGQEPAGDLAAAGAPRMLVVGPRDVRARCRRRRLRPTARGQLSRLGGAEFCHASLVELDVPLDETAGVLRAVGRDPFPATSTRVRLTLY
jgi:hypothetical protein